MMLRPVSRALLFCSLTLALGLSAAAAQTPPAPPAPPDAPPPDAPRTIAVGGGLVTGVHFPAAGALCRAVNHESVRSGLRCLVDARDGSIDNLTALRRGETDFAIVQSDWQHLAWRGEGRFAADGPFPDLRAVAMLHLELVTILARPEVAMTGPADLKGKRVNLGPPGSALRAVSDLLLGSAGLKPTDLAQAAERSPDKQGEALCAGEIDAAIFVVGHPNAAVNEAMAGCGAVAVPIDGPAAEALLKDRPWLVRAAIPAAAYAALSEEVPSVGLAAVLVTTEGQEPDVVGTVVRGLLDRFEPFRAEHPALTGIDRSRLPPTDLGTPLHPGAEAVYREYELLK